MDNRREFLKKSMLLSGAAGLQAFLPASIQRAMAINPAPGSTFLDAEHIVILMQENRSFDHCFGSLQGVRGFNDPRAISLPDKKPVWLQTNANGETYSPFRLHIKDTKVTWMGALPHGRHDQVDANNGGKYDKWLLVKRPGNKKYWHIPLTLGYYTREDLPFNYAMADAFTVCDQNFCSAMTSTTPNRAYFWTGQVFSEEAGRPKANMRNTDYTYGKQPWKTFPELLTENDVNWKFYQNDLSCGGGFVGEERSWLANFGCNNLEFYKAFNVKYSDRYVRNLQKLADTLPDEINKLNEATSGSEEETNKRKTAIAKKQEALDNARAELALWNKKNFDKLSAKEKENYERAFVINSADPEFRKLTKLKYNDAGTERELAVPAGDLFYQFRKDVKEGKLPTVSWMASPQNYSDHPSAPWYGAWYVSEVMDILTSNPEVWKKTIFIVTYDENDGYYDHIPPFSIPDNKIPGSGKVSDGIDTEVEFVRLENEIAQGIPKKQARGAAIGLGYRVPMLIASPWSRGGKVCSQLFDHTSTLQFLEHFVNNKFNKNLHHENISQWRRAICGDLTAAFTPYHETQDKLPFLDKTQFVEDIYSAKFKNEPTGYKKLSQAEIAAMIANPATANPLAEQEKGIRPSSALPYELYADSTVTDGKDKIVISMSAGNKAFGKNAQGAPFTVYAPSGFGGEVCRNWHFGVVAGDTIQYEWPVNEFAGEQYHLRLHGPNGFFREFRGGKKDPSLAINCVYELDRAKKPTGNLIVRIHNAGGKTSVVLKDHGYKQSDKTVEVPKGSKEIILPLGKQHGWYDFSVYLEGSEDFERRYAGRVETGKESFSDPVMGRMV